jgi:hypothetical protein
MVATPATGVETLVTGLLGVGDHAGDVSATLHLYQRPVEDRRDEEDVRHSVAREHAANISAPVCCAMSDENPFGFGVFGLPVRPDDHAATQQ